MHDGDSYNFPIVADPRIPEGRIYMGGIASRVGGGGVFGGPLNRPEFLGPSPDVIERIVEQFRSWQLSRDHSDTPDGVPVITKRARRVL